MSLPEGLSSFKSLNIDVCLFFLVMVLQISIRYNIVFSQSREINFLASDELNSNEQRLRKRSYRDIIHRGERLLNLLTTGGSGGGRLSGAAK